MSVCSSSADVLVHMHEVMLRHVLSFIKWISWHCNDADAAAISSRLAAGTFQ